MIWRINKDLFSPRGAVTALVSSRPTERIASTVGSSVESGGTITPGINGEKHVTAKFSWSKRSLEQLQGIHPDLRKLCDRALRLSKVDFMIIDGVRTLAEQRKHFNNGASKTMKSRHLHGYAVDLAAVVGGKIRWEEAYYKPIREAFETASIGLSIPIGKIIKWDIGHIELDKKAYPDP